MVTHFVKYKRAIAHTVRLLYESNMSDNFQIGSIYKLPYISSTNDRKSVGDYTPKHQFVQLILFFLQVHVHLNQNIFSFYRSSSPQAIQNRKINVRNQTFLS